jgi:hypothetical protein
MLMEKNLASSVSEEERKARRAEWMVPSLSLNADGSVKDVRVLRGLSPGLNNAVTDHRSKQW